MIFDHAIRRKFVCTADVQTAQKTVEQAIKSVQQSFMQFADYYNFRLKIKFCIIRCNIHAPTDTVEIQTKNTIAAVKIDTCFPEKKMRTIHIIGR